MAAYATVVEALAYVTAYTLKLSVWTDASDSDKAAALNMATRSIDQLNFQGNKASSSQTNEFPRGDDTEVPQEIQDASIEIALALLDGADTEEDTENLRVIKEKIGKAEVTYADASTFDHVSAGISSMTAWRKLLPYLRDPREIQLSRVT